MLRAVPKSSLAEAAVVKRYVEAFNRRDLQAAVQTFHPQAEIVPAPKPYYSPPGATYHGRAGAESLIRTVIAQAPDLRFEPREFRTLDGGLLVTIGLVENPSGKGATRDAVVVFRIADGQLLRLDAYTTEADAHRAAARSTHAGIADAPRLTPREREVFQLLAHGLNGWEIADQLSISPDTVRTHIRNGVLRLGAKTRVQATALALVRGEIEL